MKYVLETIAIEAFIKNVRAAKLRNKFNLLRFNSNFYFLKAQDCQLSPIEITYKSQ
jgi:hypothetical protein